MRENIILGYSTLIDSSLLIISEHAVKKNGHLGDTSLSRSRKTNPVQY